MTGLIDINRWTQVGSDGERELRKGSRIALTLLPFLLVALLFWVLVVIGGTKEGADIIAVLAYSVIALVVAASLFVLIMSLIDYLRSLE